jgi:hypothetical protein
MNRKGRGRGRNLFQNVKLYIRNTKENHGKPTQTRGLANTPTAQRDARWTRRQLADAVFWRQATPVASFGEGPRYVKLPQVTTYKNISSDSKVHTGSSDWSSQWTTSQELKMAHTILLSASNTTSLPHTLRPSHTGATRNRLISTGAFINLYSLDFDPSSHVTSVSMRYTRESSTMKMEAGRSSEMSVRTYPSSRWQIRKGSNLKRYIFLASIFKKCKCYFKLHCRT